MTQPVIASYPLPTGARLPANRVDWRCDPDRAALLIHDLQRCFVSAFDRHTSPMVELLHNLGKLRDTCRELGVPVIYSLKHGHPDGGVIDALYPAEHDTRLVDTQFPYAILRARLAAHGRDQLIVTGIRAHAGCLLAGAGPLLRDVQTFAVADAMADLSQDDHDAALDDAVHAGAMATTTSTVIGSLIGAF